MQEMFDNAFQGAVKQIVDEAEGQVRAAHETIAVFGSYDRPLASGEPGHAAPLRPVRRRHRPPRRRQRSVPCWPPTRPPVWSSDRIWIWRESIYEQVGDVLVYSKAVVRAFVVSATDAREGWPTPEILFTDTDIDAEPIPEPEPIPEEELLTAATPRRSRVWL